MNKRKVEVAECLREIECWTIWIQNASACVQPTLAFCVYFLVCNWITVEAMRIIVLMCRRIRAVVFDDWNRIPKSDKRIHRSKAREIISCRQRYGRMTLNSNWRFRFNERDFWNIKSRFRINNQTVGWIWRWIYYRFNIISEVKYNFLISFIYGLTAGYLSTFINTGEQLW